MSVALRAVVLESDDPVSLGGFWSAALCSTIGPGVEGVTIPFGEDEQSLLYIVERTRRVTGDENNETPLMHLTASHSLLEEADRLVELGAIIEEKKWVINSSLKVGWFGMADPEGNRFRLLSSDREIAEAERKLQSWS
ncbi:VOC family protein [Streptomyces sp. NPDC004296]|uniref:VOC family protein n=1 Tax=Streptomyces sp. NPDC004296 TaxID=3364697 RepID=UPI0036C32E58